MVDGGDVEMGTATTKKRGQQADYVVEVNTERRRIPWLVPMIVAANVAAFAAVMFVNDCPKKNHGGCVAVFLGRLSFQPRTEVPLLGPSSSTLDKVLEWNKTQLWRLTARMWLHSNLFQLLTNMLSLTIFGILLERQFGSVRVASIYFLSSLGGSLLSSLFTHESSSVGASGAVFGLIGAMLSELAHLALYSNMRSAALFNLFMIAAINLAFVGVQPHADYLVDFGGLLSGFLLGFVLCRWSHPSSVAPKNGDA